MVTYQNHVSHGMNTILTAQTISRPYAPMSRKKCDKKVIIKQEKLVGKTSLLKLRAVSLFWRECTHVWESSGQAARCEKRGHQPEKKKRISLFLRRFYLVPSVMHVVIFVPRGFHSTDWDQKRETVCSLTCTKQWFLFSTVLSHPCYYLP